MQNRFLPQLKLIVVAAIATCGAAFAASPTSNSDASPPAMDNSSEQGAIGSQSESATLFSKLDTNKDGMISKKEAAANKELAKQFDSLDVKKVGKLDQAEFARFEESQSSSPSPDQPTSPKY